MAKQDTKQSDPQAPAQAETLTAPDPQAAAPAPAETAPSVPGLTPAIARYLAQHYPAYTLVKIENGKAVLSNAGRPHTVTLPAL
jgi:hypothetical protein